MTDRLRFVSSLKTTLVLEIPTMSNGAEADDARLTSIEREVVKTLRQEAGEVKDCFTKFSFQALGLATAVLGIIAAKQADQPYVALAAVLVIGLLLVVSRIGIYKYTTANRNFGYELHLNRLAQIETSGQAASDLKGSREVGWEEAMRDWRVVAASVF